MMMVFDPSSRSWSTAEGPPTRREHLGVAASSGRLYVMGGRTGDLQSGVGASESYDPGAGTWTRWPSMPVPRGGLAATATANGLIVMAGGRAAGFSFSDVNEAFDLAACHSVG
jgi:Kelch motif